eukprot:scaffold1135_cov216-Pinguiococcus_pyrenoidosus.AAC.1
MRIAGFGTTCRGAGAGCCQDAGEECWQGGQHQDAVANPRLTRSTLQQCGVSIARANEDGRLKCGESLLVKTKIQKRINAFIEKGP